MEGKGDPSCHRAGIEEKTDYQLARELKKVNTFVTSMRRENEEARREEQKALRCIECKVSSAQPKQRHHHHGHKPRRSKVEFSYFSGEDPSTWLDKADYFFQIYEVPREEMVVTASRYLEGDARR